MLQASRNLTELDLGTADRAQAEKPISDRTRFPGDPSRRPRPHESGERAASPEARPSHRDGRSATTRTSYRVSAGIRRGAEPKHREKHEQQEDPVGVQQEERQVQTHDGKREENEVLCSIAAAGELSAGLRYRRPSGRCSVREVRGPSISHFGLSSHGCRMCSRATWHPSGTQTARRRRSLASVKRSTPFRYLPVP